MKDPTQLAPVTYTDVVPLIGADPYSLPEADLLSTYNSTHTTPQLLFLGLDETPPHTFTFSIAWVQSRRLSAMHVSNGRAGVTDPAMLVPACCSAQ